MRNVIAVYVENRFGVLARVSGLFMRRGFNIDSLTVGETDDPRYSRITVTMEGDENLCDQVVNQLLKLHNVKDVKVMRPGATAERELLLIKVNNSAEKSASIMAASEVYRAKTVDYSIGTITIEVTGEPSKISSFIELMKPIGIVEMCRTGVVALERGSGALQDHL